jgi:thiol-disulfide isomerase/thioredoxin
MTVRSLLLVVPVLALLAAAPCVAQEVPAPHAPIVVFFYQEGCPDCVKIAEVLDALAGDLPEGAVARYEIGDPQSRRLFQRLQKAYAIDVSSVPVVFIEDHAIAGASRANELTLSDAIGDCITGACTSPLDRIPPDVFPWRDLFELALLGSLVFLLALLQRP